MAEGQSPDNARRDGERAERRSNVAQLESNIIVYVPLDPFEFRRKRFSAVLQTQDLIRERRVARCAILDELLKIARVEKCDGFDVLISNNHGCGAQAGVMGQSRCCASDRTDKNREKLPVTCPHSTVRRCQLGVTAN